MAKKAEILDPEIVGVVDEVLTLDEVASVLAARGADPALAPASEFDPPYAGTGRIYPVPGGMFESAGIGEGLMDSHLVVVSGKDETVETLDNLCGSIDDPLLVEALMCRGCYSGPGARTVEPGVIRRRRVAEFAEISRRRQDEGTLPAFQSDLAPLSLARRFEPDDQNIPGPTEEEIRESLLTPTSSSLKTN